LAGFLGRDAGFWAEKGGLGVNLCGLGKIGKKKARKKRVEICKN
jgi:hypothetical protein